MIKAKPDGTSDDAFSQWKSHVFEVGTVLAKGYNACMHKLDSDSVKVTSVRGRFHACSSVPEFKALIQHPASEKSSGVK